VRDGRFGPFIQLGEGEKPKRSSIPKGTSPASIDLEQALRYLSLPREVAKHPETGEPILAGLGRYGPYVQHKKTYASLGRDDDVLEVGGNRAIDLIVTKESGGGRGGRTVDPGRVLGEAPEGGRPVTVKSGKYGPYVTDGETNATLPKGKDPEGLTLAEALDLLAERRAAAPAKTKRAPAKRAAGKGVGKSATGKTAKAPAAAAKRAPAKRKKAG
jgi:DNA topoisomerase-1